MQHEIGGGVVNATAGRTKEEHKNTLLGAAVLEIPAENAVKERNLWREKAFRVEISSISSETTSFRASVF
jgi:hypothetical protein